MDETDEKPIWWLPTFGFFLFLAMELWLFAAPTKIFEDPGVGRHLRSAQFILETAAVPRADSLSFTRAGQPWFDFEWGFEATLGVLYHFGGLALIAGFCYALFATTTLGVYRTLLHSGFSTSVVLITTALAFLTLHLHFSARPVLFTYLFMALVVEVWTRQVRPRRRDWIILPIVFVAWANIHAGWLAALAFLAFALAGRALDRLTGKVAAAGAPLLPWIGITLLCALATLVNPWGWNLQYHVVLLSTTYKSFALWDEFLPPNFSTPTMSALAILFIVFVVFLARGRKDAPVWRWEALFPVLFFLYEGLKTQRHVLLLVIVAAVPVARDLQSLLRFKAVGTLGYIQERLGEFQAKQRLAGGDAWLAFILIIIFSALYMRTPFGHHIHVGRTVSPELVAFIHDHPDRFHRPLTTTWNAGPLLWNARPDFRVSVDDRGDFYGDKTIFAFVDLYAAVPKSKDNPGWRATLDEGNYDSAILDPYVQLNQLLHLQPDWHEVYRDKDAVVYWRER